MIERRWASSSLRLTVTAFSASKVSVKGQMRTFVPGLEDARLPAEHLFLAHQAAIQADVFQHQLAVVHAHDGMLPRDQRALQADRVARRRGRS